MTQRNNITETSEHSVDGEHQRPKETEFDVRQIRPMIQFVDETTESRLKDIREQMTFTKAKNTMRRTGWYYTEPGTPCGYMTTQEIKASIADVFGA